MDSTDLVGVALIIFGLILAALVYLVPYVRHKPAGLVTGVILFVVGIALVSGAVQFGAPAQIVGHNGVPAVSVQNVKAISGDTYLVSQNSLNLKVDVTYNSSSHLIVAPTSGLVKFSFQLARTDTNTSAAIFDITSQNVMVENNSASGTPPASDYLVQTYNNGTTNLNINGNGYVTSSLVSVPAASIITVNVSFTLSTTAIGNLYSNAGSTAAAIGSNVNLPLIQVAGETINVDVVLASIVS